MCFSNWQRLCWCFLEWLLYCSERELTNISLSLPFWWEPAW